MARRKAQILWLAVVTDRAGAANRPRFSPEVNEFAALRSSANSWQGLIVVPGGAPAPPECRLCMPARTHRTGETPGIAQCPPSKQGA